MAGSGKEDSEETMQRKVMQKQKELEKLLMKADSDDISEFRNATWGRLYN